MAYAEEHGLRVLWLTRTASQVKHISQETGMLPLYGRKYCCIHEVVSKVDMRRFSTTCRAVRYAHRCPYWPGHPKSIAKPVALSELKELGRRLTTCPYEVLITSMPSAKAIVATHKQLSVIGWLFAKWIWSRERTLVIFDEGQNIVNNVLSMTKDTISISTVKKAALESRRFGFSSLADELSNAVRQYESMLSADGEAEVEDLLPSYSDLLLAGEEVQELKLKENLAPTSYLLSIADFKANLAGQKPLLVREGKKIRLEAPADPADVLAKTYEGWRATITMSATISADFLERLLGREFALLRAGWPYGDNLQAVVVRGLTTKYEKRDKKMMEDIQWLLRLVERRKALVFLPSHDIVESIDVPDGMLRETRDIEQDELERITAQFTESEKGLVAIFNGRLSEGVDLPSNLVILIGIPFVPPTTKNMRLIHRLAEILGDEKKAKLYGVVLPGLWSALQAAGRAVRGPDDRATVLLVDDRYQKLIHLMPR